MYEGKVKTLILLNLFAMEYFIYESELRLLCCRTCQTMVTRKQVKLHLRSAPHNLNSREIKLAQVPHGVGMVGYSSTTLAKRCKIKGSNRRDSRTSPLQYS
jgi:hypothetical protein